MDERTQPTQLAAAKALGVHSRGFHGWCQRDDWPFGRRGPFDIPAVIAWRVVVVGWDHDGKAPEPDHRAFEAAMAKAGLALPESGSPMPTAIGQANLRYRLAQIRKLELDHDITRGKYIEKTVSDAAYFKMVAITRAKVEQFVGAMPEMFHDCSRERIAQLATDRYDRICRELRAIEPFEPVPAKREKPADAKKSKAASKRHGRRKM